MVGFEKDAVSLGTFSTAVKVSSRIDAEQMQSRFKTEGGLERPKRGKHSGEGDVPLCEDKGRKKP